MNHCGFGDDHTGGCNRATNGQQLSTMVVVLLKKRSNKGLFMRICPDCALIRPKLCPKMNGFGRHNAGIKAVINLRANFTKNFEIMIF